MKKLKSYGRLFPLALMASLMLLVVGCSADDTVDRESQESETSAGDNAEAGETAGSEEADDASSADSETEQTTYTAQIEVEGYGTITVELDESAAPETVENFVALAREGFYDGLTFHRIIDGFMIQGGDPNGDGTGGSETAITGEFSDNGVENPLSHTRGAISMARSEGDYNSASSQFFIVQEDSTELDGSYAVFGYVTDGMDVVDAICADAQPIDDNGLIAQEEQPVITSITILEDGESA